jgi:hypothetical protein
MTRPIRSVVFDKIKAALEDVPEIETVRLFQVVPQDVSAIPLPAAYVFEIAPEDRSYSNRLAIAKMHLMVQVFFSLTLKDLDKAGFSEAYELMDVLAARLHAIYHTNVGLSKNGLVNVVEITYDRIITNESVGMLNSTFDVEYRHDRGNAFS